MDEKKINMATEQLERVHRDMNDCVNRFILKDAIDQLKEQVKNFSIPEVGLSAYYVNPMGEPIIVLAKNMAEACDKLDKAGIKDYVFVHSHSFDVVH